jgi:hypothetical protein
MFTMMKQFRVLGMAVLAGTLACATASAAFVGSGTFNLTGTAVGAIDGVNFYYVTPGDQESASVNPSLGVFSTLAPGTLETIRDLTAGNGVIPGTSFDFQNWIQLTDGINLDVTSIPLTSYGVCPGSGSVAVGFSCVANAASPIVLTQGTTGVSAVLALSGWAHFVGSTDYTAFTGQLTAPSTNFATIADFEQYFDTYHTIPAVSYSASFTTVTPEPAAFWLACAGLLGFGVLGRKKRAVR